MFQRFSRRTMQKADVRHGLVMISPSSSSTSRNTPCVPDATAPCLKPFLADVVVRLSAQLYPLQPLA